MALACVAFLIGFTVFGNQTVTPDEAPTSAQVRAGQTPSAEVVERLIERFDCWTGAAPADMAGQVPGHVIVTRPGDEQPVRGGDVLVGKALDQIFAGAGTHLEVHAFCR